MTDYTDPCAVVAILRPAYYQLIAGGGAMTVRIENREVTFAKTDLALLRGEIERLDAQCAGQEGETRRHAIRAGSYYGEGG